MMDHQVEIQDARLRDKKQVRRLNIAMTLAGCAFLVTTVGCVARIEDVRKNAQILPDVSTNITDVKLSMNHQVPGIMHVSLEEVPTAMMDETLPAKEIPQSGAPSSEEAVSISVNTLAGQEAHTAPEGGSGISEVVSLPHESQSKPFGYNEMSARGRALVPVTMSPAAAVPARETVAPATPKTAPDTVTSREGLSSADEIPETVALAHPYDRLADLVRLGGRLPANSGSENSLSAGLNSVRQGMRQYKAFAEITHGQDDNSTFVKGSYNVGKLFSVGAAFTQKNRDDEFQPLTDQKKGFWNVKMNSSLLGPSLDAEMALSSFDTETSKNFWTSEYRMLKLGSQTTWQGFNIGARYQSVGKDFENSADMLKSGYMKKKKKKNTFEKDMQGPELWSYRKFGKFGVKTYTSLYSNNLAGDRTLPRFTTYKVGSSVNYLISSWPQVGVTLNYATGTLDSSDEPAGFDSVSQDVRDIASSIYYTGNLWSGSLSVENSTGKANAANVTDMQLFYAEASYLPVDTVSISPSISYIREKYPEFDVGSDTLSSSLTLGYKPKPDGFSYSLYGEYSTEENTDWGVDNSYLYTSLGVNWDSKKPKTLIKQWSAELFYDQYVDNIYIDSNTGGLGFMLKLRSSPMPSRLFVNEVR